MIQICNILDESKFGREEPLARLAALTRKDRVPIFPGMEKTDPPTDGTNPPNP